MENEDITVVNDELIEDQPGSVQEAQPEPEKLFSQTELDKIIQRRLLSERSKYESEVTKIKTEFERKKYVLDAERELLNRGYSTELLTAFSADSVDDLSKHLDIVDKIVNQRADELVDRRLRQKTPAAPTTPRPDNGIRDAFGLNN